MFIITSTCKGGGYTYARTQPLHPRANSKGLYPLHRVLMENHLGRLLGLDEVVHHRDKDRFNNSLDNLEVLTRSDHSRHHHAELRVVVECGACGEHFQLSNSVYRSRFRRHKGPTLACSRSVPYLAIDFESGL